MCIFRLSVSSVLVMGMAACAAASGLWDAAWSADGRVLAVTDRKGRELRLIEGDGLPVRVALDGPATGVVWHEGCVLVAEYDCGTVAVVDPLKDTVVQRFTVGPKPMGLAVAGDILLVAEYGRSELIGINLNDGSRTFTLPVKRHPVDVAAAPDGSVALTAGLLPDGKAGPEMAAELILLNPRTGAFVARLPLPDGSSNVRGFAVSPDGKVGVAVHTRGRTAVPSTQIDRGWININMITLVDLEQRQVIASCILDAPYKGAADPWGVGFASDGSVWISLAGTHELMQFDLPRFFRLLNGEETLPPEPDHRRYSDRGTLPTSQTAPQLWEQLAAGTLTTEVFAGNMSMLSGIDLTRRIPVGIEGPRALAIRPGGRQLALLGGFDGDLLLADALTGEITARRTLGEKRPLTAAGRGERIFFDGRISFQGWMSCATCHHEARTDGLNWDLMNSGLGFPENTKSMLHCPRTPPMTWTGVRPDAKTSIEKGFYFMMYVLDESEVADVLAYFESLEPEHSPWLERTADGTYVLSAAAERGRGVFEKAGCAVCHSGPLMTDLKSYDVGSGGTFDTPPLIEIWRTAPYLHDGSTATLTELINQAAVHDLHGELSSLDDDDRAALAAYLLSL